MILWRVWLPGRKNDTATSSALAPTIGLGHRRIRGYRYRVLPISTTPPSPLTSSPRLHSHSPYISEARSEPEPEADVDYTSITPSPAVTPTMTRSSNARPASTATAAAAAAATFSAPAVEAKAASMASETNAKVTPWASPGPAAFDFRSDVVTTPTASMLAAISSTSLLDDVFMEDPTTNALEQRIASLTGKPAALLVLSGTMGNQIALRTHLAAPPHGILCDHRGHILEWEAGGAAALCGALVKGVRPANGHHLTLADVRKEAVVSEDVHACPTRLVSLENTLAGTVMPLADVREIAKWCGEQEIKVHLDGARLWEAVAAGAGGEVGNGEPGAAGADAEKLASGLKAYCDCFDSVNLCFSKGLGAPVASMIVGSEAFIKRARWVRKSIGGGLRQAGVVSAAARVAVEETFLGGKLKATHDMAKRIEKMWVDKGGKLTQPVETNMVWLDLSGYGLAGEEDAQSGELYKKDAEGAGVDFVELGLKHGLRLFQRGRMVVHYQIGEEAVRKLEALFDELMEQKAKMNGTSEGMPAPTAATSTNGHGHASNGASKRKSDVAPPASPQRASKRTAKKINDVTVE